MIRITKQLLFNPANIWLSNINCTASNITRIANVLNCKWMVMTIDSLPNDCSFLEYIKKLDLKLFVNQHTQNNYEVSVVLPNFMLESVLEKAISEDPDSLFILDVLDPEREDTHVLCSSNFEQLVTAGITRVFISISFDEQALRISVNNALTQPLELYRKIKALRFD